MISLQPMPKDYNHLTSAFDCMICRQLAPECDCNCPTCDELKEHCTCKAKELEAAA